MIAILTAFYSSNFYMKQNVVLLENKKIMKEDRISLLHMATSFWTYTFK
jgi:hypothetical protein